MFCFVFFYLYLNKFFLHDFLTWWYKQYFSVNFSFTEVQFSKSLSQVTCQRFPRCGSVKFKVCLNCLPPNFRLKFSLTLLLQILLLLITGKSCPELEKNKSNLDFPWSCQRWNTKKGAFHNKKILHLHKPKSPKNKNRYKQSSFHNKNLFLGGVTKPCCPLQERKSERKEE